MRKILSILAAIAIGSLAHAQTLTPVTATVADASGQTWYNGTITATLFNPSSTMPPVYTKTGQPVQTIYTANLSSAGQVSLSLPDNLAISPSGSSWKFTVCSATSAPCVNLPSTLITGSATINLTSFISVNLPAISVSINGIGMVYSGSEVKNPVNGTTVIVSDPTSASYLQSFVYTQGAFALVNPSPLNSPANGSSTATSIQFFGAAIGSYTGISTANGYGGGAAILFDPSYSSLGPGVGVGSLYIDFAQPYNTSNIGGTFTSTGPNELSLGGQSSGTVPVTFNVNGTLNGTTINAQTIRSTLDATAFAGADACAKINAAIAALPATGGVVDARGFGATTQVVTTTCASSTTTSGTQQVTLLFNPATVFEPATTTTVVLNWMPNTVVEGLTVTNSNVTGYTGTVVEMVNPGGQGNLNQYSKFTNFRLFGNSGYGTGIALAPASAGLAFENISHGTITGFNRGIYLDGASGFVNGISVDDVNDTASTYCLTLKGTSANQVAGNVFTNVQCEGNGTLSNSTTALTLIYATDNVFTNFDAWDYSASGQSPLSADANSVRNLWQGGVPAGSGTMTNYPGNQIPLNQGEWITSTGGGGNPLEYSYGGFQLLTGSTTTPPVPTARGISASQYNGTAGGGDLDFWINSNYVGPAFNFYDGKTTALLSQLTPGKQTYNVAVHAPSIDPDTAQTTVTGTTAGTAVFSQPFQGTAYKAVIVYLNGYENTTATAQTYTLPTAFTTVSGIVAMSGVCSNISLVSDTTVNLPVSMSTAQTGLCKVEGY